MPYLKLWCDLSVDYQTVSGVEVKYLKKDDGPNRQPNSNPVNKELLLTGISTFTLGKRFFNLNENIYRHKQALL